MRKSFYLLLSLLIGGLSLGFSQTYVFTYRPNAGNPGNVNTDGDVTTTGWVNIAPGSQSANSWSSTVTIPFPFQFYGTPVTHLKASQNMVVTFDTLAALPGPNVALPTAGLPNLAIAGFWDSFTNAPPTGSNDNIQVKTFGTAPNRQLWIRWFSFEHGSPNVSFVYNSIVLEETSNKVYISDMYSSTTPTPLLTATVGVQQNSSSAVMAGANLSLSGNGTSISDNDYYEFTPVVNANDIFASGVRLRGIARNGCGTAAEPVRITLQNLGFNTATNILVSFSVDGGPFTATETVAGPIATGDTLQYLFSATADLSAPGPHTIQASTTLAGDANLANNTAQTTVTTTLPVSTPLGPLNFTGYNSTNIGTLYPGWRENTGRYNAVTPGNVDAVWVNDDFGNVVGGPNGVSIKFNIYTTNRFGWFLSPKFTATANSQLEYDIAQTNFAVTTPATFGADDSLVVAISTDCGVTFTPLQFYGNGVSLPTTGQRNIHSLAAYAGQDVIIGFYASSGPTATGDYDVFVDNLEVRNVFQNDVQPIRVRSNSLANNGCGTGASPLTVVVQNRGSQPASAIQVSYSINGSPFTAPETIAGPVVTNDSAIYTFTAPINLAVPGNYNVRVVATLVNDQQVVNDTLTRVFTTVAPVAQPIGPLDFNGFNGTNLGTLYPGWRENTGRFNAPTPANADDSWTNDDFGNVVGGPNGNSIRYNIFSTNNFGWFLSPKFTATANSQLEYDIAQTTFSGTASATFGADDSLVIAISTDCGVSFTPIQFYGSGTSLPTTGQRNTHSLAAFAGQDVIIGFYASSGPTATGDYNVYVDNLGIRQVFPNDAAAVQILGLASGCSLPAATPVSVSFRNLGTTLLDSLNVSVSVNGGAFSAPELFLPNLVTNGLDTVTLASALNLSAAGTYNIRIVTAAVGEQNPVNDTARFTVVSQPVITSFPYFQDFEAGSDWISTGANSTWAYGTPAKAIINSAASGTKAWVVGGLTSTTTYNASESSALLSPCFDMTAAPSGLWVGLKVWWEAEFTWDGAALQYTTDGVTWVTIGAVGDPFNWYTDNTINGNPGGQQSGWSGSTASFPPSGSGGWRQALRPLPSALAGQPSVRFRIAFGADPSVQHEGIAFDDFGIGVPPVVSLGTDSLTYCIGSVISAGNPGSTYAWSNGATTPSIALVNATGAAIEDSVISVLVTDQIGLFGRDTIVVSIAAVEPAVSTTVLVNALCFEDANGEAVAIGSGNGNLSYEWNTIPAQTTATATGLAAGVYVVTLTDEVGCEATDSVTISQPDSIALSGATVNQPLCFGDSTGEIIISVVGGTAPYSFNWSNGDTTQNVLSAPAGGYQGTITDANGCVFVSDTVNLVYPDAIALSGATVTQPLCFGDSTGAIAITVVGGTGSYSFNWSNGDTTQNVTGAPAGAYQGTITDANGCVFVSDTVDLVYPDAIAVVLDSIVNADCFNGTNGGIFITVSGGTGAYTYLWSNDSTSGDLTGLTPGDYTGTITDANGCELVSPVLTVGFNDTLPVPSFTFVVGGGRVEFTNTSVGATGFTWDFGDGTGTSNAENPFYVYATNDTFVVTLTVTNACGRSEVSQTIIMSTVSIDRELESRINVYPNPTEGKLRVDFDRVAASDIQIRVYSVHGQLVKDLRPDQSGTFSQELDLTNVAEGTYMIQVIADGKVAMKQVIRN